MNFLLIFSAVKVGGFLRLIDSKQKKLDFPVENFFCIGSPLAIFLALRGFRAPEIISKKICRRMFNIYHPADPVAYRMEPLLNSDYMQVKPVKVHFHSAKNKEAYEEIVERHYDLEKKKSKTKSKKMSQVINPIKA